MHFYRTGQPFIKGGNGSMDFGRRLCFFKLSGCQKHRDPGEDHQYAAPPAGGEHAPEVAEESAAVFLEIVLLAPLPFIEVQEYGAGKGSEPAAGRLAVLIELPADAVKADGKGDLRVILNVRIFIGNGVHALHQSVIPCRVHNADRPVIRRNVGIAVFGSRRRDRQERKKQAD